MILTNDKHWLENEYQQACQVPNEIHQHLPVLRQIADTCESVTEFGIALGYSTRAFLSSNASKIRSYDVNIYHTIPELFAAARRAGKDAQFIQASTLATSIEQTDFLFVDSLHTYKQVKQELELHGKHVTKYIAFHDTYTYGLVDEWIDNGPGILSAILEWLASNPKWRLVSHTWQNNGLTVVEKST